MTFFSISSLLFFQVPHLFLLSSGLLFFQVAAMFERMMPGQVALCTDQMAYRPEAAKEQSNIVVGTPQALESSLSKVSLLFY
jgi:hypothetical protein